LAAYGAMVAERLVRSDRLEEAVAEMHEGMRHFAHDADLKMGRGPRGRVQAILHPFAV
jgi:hypothetical protein